MSGGYQQIVNRSPWVEMARLDAREWFRDHRGAPLEEFDQWVRRYERDMLRGAGYAGGRLTHYLSEMLDDIHVGLTQAVHEKTRSSRVA